MKDLYDEIEQGNIDDAFQVDESDLVYNPGDPRYRGDCEYRDFLDSSGFALMKKTTSSVFAKMSDRWGKMVMALLCVLLMSCSSQKLIRDSAIAASTARVIEAYRDAEMFEHPTDDRSLEWHICKVPQFGAWAYYGYRILDADEPLPKKLLATGASLGIAFVIFEGSLWIFRK